MPGKILFILWFWIFNKKSNIVIWREICKRTRCPSIVNLALIFEALPPKRECSSWYSARDVRLTRKHFLADCWSSAQAMDPSYMAQMAILLIKNPGPCCIAAVMDFAAVQVVGVADGVLVLGTLGTTDHMCFQCWHTAAALDGDGIWVCLFGLRLGFLLWSLFIYSLKKDLLNIWAWAEK